MARSKLDELTNEVCGQLGRRLRSARLQAGVSQQAAAIGAEMDLRQWQRLEAGASGVTVRTLVRAALVVRTTFWDLVCAERFLEEPPPIRPQRRRRK